MKDSETNITGMDVTANQDEISDNETFQLEFQADAAKWNFRTLQDKYEKISFED